MLEVTAVSSAIQFRFQFGTPYRYGKVSIAILCRCNENLICALICFIHTKASIMLIKSLNLRISFIITLALMHMGVLLMLMTTPVMAKEVGEVDVDWLGNDIIIEAIADPKVKGVTCHVAYFERGLIDRLQKGKWFEDPSNSSLSCRQTGPIVIGDIDKSKDGEKVFSQRQSLIWKSVRVTRVYDETTNTLVYLAHAAQVQDGSAKMSISTVPLFGTDVKWEKE